MSLLEITGLSHTFGDNLLYKDAEFTLNKGEHIGIVGQNGTGKSTLLHICTGQLIPDKGRVLQQQRISIGYLDQYARIDKNMTMKMYLKSAFLKLYTMEKKMNTLYEQAASGAFDVLEQAAKYQEQLEQNDFYSIDTHIEQIAAGLGLDSIGLEHSIGEMSGGQRAKVILAKLLLEKPDILLLDEPTNFLDKEHIAWLANYLKDLEKAYLVITHDYGFLEKIANQICDIDNEKITKYYGTYSEFIKKKTCLRDDYIRQYTAQQKEIKKTEAFIRKNIAGRKSKMARGRQKQLDRMDKIEALNLKEIKPLYHFDGLAISATDQLLVNDLSVGYGTPILENVKFAVKGGEKVVLTGFNGVGKSTLLKTLIKEIPALQGTFSFSRQVELGYYEQDLIWKDKARTPVQIIMDAFPFLVIKEVYKHLARCGISNKHGMQPIGTLSGGEQAKVKMCMLTMKPCNFLILDEPTNHLDIQAKESLKKALAEFSGSVLLVSHEEDFYRNWTNRTICIN